MLNLKQALRALAFLGLLCCPAHGQTTLTAPPTAAPVAAQFAPTVLFVGDSYIADGFTGNGNGTVYAGRFPFWILTSLHHRVSFDLNTNVFATSGYTSTQWISTYLQPCATAIRTAIASGSPVDVFMDLGLNDAGSPFTFAASKANFDQIFSTLSAAGANIFIGTIPPQSGSGALSANGEKLRNQLNAYFSAYGHVPGSHVTAVDVSRALTDGTGAQLSGYFLSDGRHPSAIGSAAGGKVFANAIAPYLPFDFIPDQIHTTDVYDATYAPFGNKITTPLLGTTGAKSNGQVTGNVPTNWSAGGWTNNNASTAGTNLTAALSQVTSNVDLPNEPMVQLALSGPASSEMIILQPTNFPVNTNGVPGEIYQGGVTLEWDAGCTGISSFGVSANYWYQGTVYEGSSLDGASPWPGATAGHIQLVTNPFTVPTGYGNQNIQFHLIAQGSTAAAASCNARFSQPWLRKIGPVP